jgi:hypothetical protein
MVGETAADNSAGVVADVDATGEGVVAPLQALIKIKKARPVKSKNKDDLLGIVLSSIRRPIGLISKTLNVISPL